MESARRLLLLLLIGLTGCARHRGVFPGCSIFVISIDTMRSDHLPAYGYRAVTTPNIDGLAADSVLFERAYTHVPLTLPSHASLFTGVLPADNGVHDNVGYALAASHETMASFFAARGYATGAAVSAIVLSHETGIAKGFEFYEDAVEPVTFSESLGRVRRAGPETERKLVDWISSEKRRPLFAFLHLYEPHTPYEPEEPFASRYRDRPYDGEIAAVDAVVGSFLEELKSRGLYDDSIVVLLSDHGEGLGDHGEAEHGIFLYREAIQVPVLLKVPGGLRRRQRIAAPIGLTDLFPTLAALAGLEPPPHLSGVSLEAIFSGGRLPERAIYSETSYARFHLGWSELASLATARHHYIEAPRPELYDLASDPSEKNDLAPARTAEFRRLRLELSRHRQTVPPPGASEPERARKLASLGYLTGAAPAVSGPLPDPKDHIREVERLKEAFGFFSSGRYDQAASLLRALLDAHPSMSDAWEIEAQALRRLGRADEALAAYRQADRLTPGNAPLLLEMSLFFLETDRPAEALRFARLAEAAGSPQVHETLAQIAIASGDLALAEREARQALGDRPGRRVPLLILARICRDRGDLAGALAYLDQLREMTNDRKLRTVGTANALRGDVLARLGDKAGAEAAFREEIRLFPQNPQSWCSLALLYASQGRENPARETLLALVRAQPQPASYHAAARTAEIFGDRQTASTLDREAKRRFGKGLASAPRAAPESR